LSFQTFLVIEFFYEIMFE